MNESRYIHYDIRRLPRQKRSIQRHGAVSYIDGKPVKDQSETLWRCWNCGHLVNESYRNAKLGDGVGYKVIDVVDEPDADSALIADPTVYIPWNFIPSLENTETIHLMQLDSEGDPVTVMHNNSQVVSSGCPLCGTRQYR